MDAVEQWEGVRRESVNDTDDTLLQGEAWYVEQGLIEEETWGQ